MRIATARGSLGWLGLLGVGLVASSCRGGASSPAKEPPRGLASDSAASTHGTVGVAPIATDLLLPSIPTGGPPSNAPLPPPEERPPCAKDEDCWSWTCCPATLAEHCVHGSLAQKCALIDMKCAKSEVHYECVCVANQCAGRLHP